MSCIAESPKAVPQPWLPSTGAMLGWITRRTDAIGRAIAGRRVLREVILTARLGLTLKHVVEEAAVQAFDVVGVE